MVDPIPQIAFDSSFIGALNLSEERRPTHESLLHYEEREGVSTISSSKKSFWNRYRIFFSPTHDMGKIAELVATRIKQERYRHHLTALKCVSVLSRCRNDLTCSPPLWSLLDRLIRWIKRDQIHEQIQKIDQAIAQLTPLLESKYTDTPLDELDKRSLATACWHTSAFLLMSVEQQESAFRKTERFGWDIMESFIILKNRFQSLRPQGGISCVAFPDSLSDDRSIFRFNEYLKEILLSDNGNRYVALVVNLGPSERDVQQTASLLIDKKEREVHYFDPQDGPDNSATPPRSRSQIALSSTVRKRLSMMALPEQSRVNLLCGTPMQDPEDDYEEHLATPSSQKLPDRKQSHKPSSNGKSKRGKAVKKKREKEHSPNPTYALPEEPEELLYKTTMARLALENPKAPSAESSRKPFPEETKRLFSEFGFSFSRSEKTTTQTSPETSSFVAVHNILNFFKDPLVSGSQIDLVPLRVWGLFYRALRSNPPTSHKIVKARENQFYRARSICLAIFGYYLKEKGIKPFCEDDERFDKRYVQSAFPHQPEEYQAVVKWVNEQFIAWEARALTLPITKENFMVPILEMIAEKLLRGQSQIEREISYALRDLAEIFASNSDLYKNADRKIAHKRTSTGTSVLEETIDSLLKKREDRRNLPSLQKPAPPPRSPLQRTERRKLV